MASLFNESSDLHSDLRSVILNHVICRGQSAASHVIILTSG
jgi:hypothetical protein